MSTENEIRKASEKFYAALNQTTSGNAEPTADVWSHSPTVSTAHPIGGRQVGWDEVWASWENVASISAKGQVKLSDQIICLADDLAYESGIEHLDVLFAGHKIQADIRVTNIYRREGDEWKIVHHHTDLSPAIQEVLSNLPSGR